jgi:hypothetical protein
LTVYTLRLRPGLGSEFADERLELVSEAEAINALNERAGRRAAELWRDGQMLLARDQIPAPRRYAHVRSRAA